MFRSSFLAALASFVAVPGLLFAQEYKTPPKAQAIALPAPPAAALTKLTVDPAQTDLAGPHDEQRIGIVGTYAGGRTWDLSRTAKLTSANPKIAEVDPAGIIWPVGDGTTTITIEANGKSESIPVKVSK